MLGRFVPRNPTQVVVCYLGVLFANVAGLMDRPFSKVLTFLLFAWTGVFFLFALAVFAFCIVRPLVPLHREFRDGPASELPSPTFNGMWDRELDG